MAYRKIPKKIVILGDITKGKQYLGQADSQLNILQNQMSFQNLQQSWRTVRLAKDVIVECFSGFNLSEVRIHATPLKPLEPSLEPERLCFCNCCVAIGRIKSSYSIRPDGWLPRVDDKYYYDVEVCQKRAFLLIENIWSTDHFQHREDDLVLLTARPYLEDESQAVDFIDVEICDWIDWRISSINPSIQIRGTRGWLNQTLNG